MSARMLAVFSLMGGMLTASAKTAEAQWMPAGNPCGCSAPVMQPVVQSCYQTVPVTEYIPVKQTVQRPVMKTAYVDQKYTELRPVTETKTASIPTVSYQTVTECQAVQRDMGCYQSWSECVNRPTACQYDNRPGLMGWMNRTGYSIRSAFQPRVVARRQWVPNIVTTMVPVNRQVAQYGTRQVAYNVTTMVPFEATRKVAVNTVEYETAEVTVMQTRTVMRTIPSGTSIAYVPAIGGTATALAPVADPATSAAKPETIKRSAAADKDAFPSKSKNDSSSLDNDKKIEPLKKSVFPTPVEPEADNEQQAKFTPAKLPSIVRVSGWVARNRTAESAGPEIAKPTVEVAGTK